MHKGLITCPPDTSLGKVATMLTERHVHALVVAEEADHLLGVISDFDLLAGEWLSVDEDSLNTMRKLTARDLMSCRAPPGAVRILVTDPSIGVQGPVDDLRFAFDLYW
jgi:predicted transcriptional regulator